MSDAQGEYPAAIDRAQPLKGRGSHINPPNRFLKVQAEADHEHVEHDAEYLESLAHPATEYIPDASQSIISENDSPDIPFRYSLNPYRGCLHGCAYCYARPSHEFLGFSAGLDFETKVVYKPAAGELLREFLARKSWRPEAIILSGVTDCYQPAERRFRLTRACLEVALEARQPLSIITKNALILRDLDLLSEMASHLLVHAAISITTLDAELARTLEPRTSSPTARLRAIRELSAAGIPVRVMVAPIIPGLNDSEAPAVLAAAKEAGATTAGYTLLRLPLAVAPVFGEWLARTQPDKQQRIENRIRATRQGKLNDSRFGDRMKGTGEIADQISKMFHLFAHKLGLDAQVPEQDVSQFHPPLPTTGQMRLF